MFTSRDRERIREALIDRARSESDVVGAAVVGSAARGLEDAWSDIDLALQLAAGADEAMVVADWTAWLGAEFGMADFFDVLAAGGVRYRVFLLPSSLQIDVSFWPHDEFRATAEAFQLLFGQPAAPTSASEPDIDSLIGLAWLYALHARSALKRGRLWQCVLMLDDLRNQVIALMCVRHDLNPWHGREVDRLPDRERAMLDASRAADTSPEALGRSKRLLVELFLDEIERHDPARAASLRTPLTTIARPD